MLIIMSAFLEKLVNIPNKFVKKMSSVQSDAFSLNIYFSDVKNLEISSFLSSCLE